LCLMLCDYCDGRIILEIYKMLLVAMVAVLSTCNVVICVCCP